jgi:amino acid adenylation domain-containing protein
MRPTPDDINEKALPKGLSPAKRALLKRRLCGNKAADSPSDRVERRNPSKFLPISIDQRRIWVHAQTNPDVPLYNEAITVHRKGNFDAAVFEAAFNEILRRHEAWRSSFECVNGNLAQIIHHGLQVSFPLTDLSSLPLHEREAEAVRIAKRDAQTPILLDQAPLLRGHIVRMAPDEHRIYLTLHHVIFDGVSIYKIFMPELMEIYKAYADGREHSLAEPALQYGDYTLWRGRHTSSPTFAHHIEYWKKQLSGELPLLNLPFDRPRPSRPSHRGAMECFKISNELIDRLRNLAVDHGATLYMVLLAAYKTLLFRYSGQQDLIVGGAADARRLPELESVMGYMLDTIPIRTRPTSELPFDQFLLQVRDSVLGALAAAETPFDQIVKAVGQSRSDHSPVFQAFFSIEPPAPAFTDGWDLTQMDVTVGSSKFDLYLELDQQPEAMAARIMYSTDVFDPLTIRRMADHYRVIVESLPAQFDCPLGRLPLLTDAEIALSVGPSGWNDTAQTFPQETLHALIESQAKLSPNATAIVAGNESWTYAKLFGRVETLSAGLRAAGVKRGDLVAVNLQRTADMVASLLAILKTGAAYMPLEPESPVARLTLLIENAKPEFVLVDGSAPALSLSSGSILRLEELSELGHDFPQTGDDATLEDLAYVINTSGTTGIPKGVEISHRSLVNALYSFQKKPGFTARDRMLAITTISFDIAALELFLPLISGGAVVLETRTVALDPQLLIAAIARSRCSVLQATPATWHSLLAAGWIGPGRQLKALCGGEAMSRELADGLLERGLELWNMYGPTEATIWATVQQIEHNHRPISIGKPIGNMSAFVLDAGKQLVPAGVPGNLHIGGLGLARGYHRNAEATRQRFFNVEAAGGIRLYDTGDIAVQRADGTLECHGRSDHQVKVRGYRIELEAVEAAVRRHPQVAAAAARVWPDDAGSNRLSVYIVGKNGAPPDAAELRRFLKQDQPEWIIPSDVVALDALPMSTAGKIDRARLPIPQVRERAAIAITELTFWQRRLAAIWSEVLKVPSISPRDNFFDLGGHSLMLAVLSHRIEKAFGRRISIATLFQKPTLEGQAGLLESSADAALSGLIEFRPNGTRPPLFWLHPPAHIVHIAEALGPDQPMLGVALTESNLEKLGPEPTLESIAALHAREILDAHPRGPIFLGGFCTGGIVAFEIAAQLQKAGHQVPLVILLDAQNPVFFRRVSSVSIELSKAYFYIKRAIVQQRTQHSATLQQRFHRLITLRKEVWRPRAVETETVLGQHKTDAAAYLYRPHMYTGDVLLIQPKDRPAFVDHAAGWRTTIAGKLITEEVAGHHDELLDRENSRGVAAVMASHFGQACGLFEERDDRSAGIRFVRSASANAF